MLRVATAGSVDDGKSTLIGRLLYDSKSLMADHVETAEADLARLTDGLRAEREQGITIDVAYRAFATPGRRFTLHDCPGHAQYTRNMVTGASTADHAVVLVDALRGLAEQGRRHATIAALLRVPSVTVAVNKMDLVGYAEDAFDSVAREVADLAVRVGLRDVTYIPVSALAGDNVVERSPNMPWYAGPPLLEHLENVPAHPGLADGPARLPVQLVTRASGVRWYGGRLLAGTLRPGDEVVVLPGGQRTRVARVAGPGEERPSLAAPLSGAVALEDDIDVGRGDLLAAADDAPVPARELSATVCWLSEAEACPGARYTLKHTTRAVKARLEAVDGVLDVVTLERSPAPALGLNAIGSVRLRTADPVAADPYDECRPTGAFILVDEATGDTVAAGMVARAPAGTAAP